MRTAWLNGHNQNQVKYTLAWFEYGSSMAKVMVDSHGGKVLNGIALPPELRNAPPAVLTMFCAIAYIDLCPPAPVTPPGRTPEPLPCTARFPASGKAFLMKLRRCAGSDDQYASSDPKLGSDIRR
jgi:hypothetical protein